MPANIGTWGLAGSAKSVSLERMTETEIFACLILLVVCAACLVLAVAAVIRNGRSLQRIEQALKTRDSMPKAAAAGGGVAASRGEFETFLAEDPQRLLLAKSEQFKAYRHWRRDKGLNWSKP
ncbi:MAG: hypothetical protein DVB25_07245 [Verrucomicrobia bacterium]|nr:MAG: hypothetical protein DVB25_07245 [Verrucomicrobiota bacterium]